MCHRVSGCSATWGPLPLLKAHNGTFNSLTMPEDPLSFDLRQIPVANRSQSAGSRLNNNFDIIVLIGSDFQKTESARSKSSDSPKIRTVVFASPSGQSQVNRGNRLNAKQRQSDVQPHDSGEIQRQATYFRIRHGDSSCSGRVHCSSVLQKVCAEGCHHCFYFNRCCLSLMYSSFKKYTVLIKMSQNQ